MLCLIWYGKPQTNEKQNPASHLCAFIYGCVCHKTILAPLSTSDLIAEIRDYQTNNPVLLQKSHHFVFDCPLEGGSMSKPDYIWMGLNPRNDSPDWERTSNKNDEETRERNFQEIFGRSRSSKERMTKAERFLGTDYFHSTTHTKLFFWCSNGISNDFELRYGTSFGNSPHVNFYCKINKRLIETVEPKAMFF